LIHDPPALILDEPTNGLDPRAARDVQDRLRRSAAGGKTIFLSTHLLDMAEKLCTRVAIMHHGALLREGSIDDLTLDHPNWIVDCLPVPDHLAAALGLVPDSRPPAPGLRAYRTGATDRTALSAVLSGLLEAGVEIEAVRPGRLTLEESFLHLSPLLFRQQREIRPLPREVHQDPGIRLGAERRREADAPLLVHLVLVFADEPAHGSGLKWNEVG
jgi:ABC-type multidrug transport system ATPase subunit